MANGTGYSAGNLEFSVQQISNATLSSLDRLVAKLQTTMKLLGNVSSLTKSLGTTIRKGTGSAFSKTKESSTFRTANGQTYLQQQTQLKLIGSQIAKVTTKFNEQGKVLRETTTSVDEYGRKITNIFDNATKKISNTNKNIKDTNKKISAFKISDLLNKVYFIRNYTKQMLRSVVDIVKNAVDYTETLNLWQVAMRGNTQEAEEFIKTMNKGYGVATQTLMQYQAIFRNMLSSLGGINENISYQLSEYLTQMALDYASLYNVSIQKAMTTFQSVLSGQVRPIRSIAGYDITETTIYQLYQQLGGTKTMRQLSQTEKRLLRIYAVFQQMESSGAVGDLSKTMESTANQMRVFSESAKELGTWLGIILEHYLKPILPVLNAVTITLTNIVKAIAQMKNIKPQEFGAVESVAELNEELDKTQGKLLSFDRFEALNSGEDNALGIDDKLLAGLSKYESVMGGLEKKTQELVDKWAEFWFVGGDYENGLTSQAQALLNILNAISIILPTLIVSRKIGKNNILKDAIALLSLSRESSLSLKATAEGVGGVSKSVMGLSKILGFITSPLGIILATVGVLYFANEDFRESINLLFETLSPLINMLFELVSDIIKPLMPLLNGIINMVGTRLSYAIKSFNVLLSGAILTLVPFAYALEFVLKVLQSISQALADIASFNWDNFGANQQKIWSNWKSNDFTKIAWGNFSGSFSAFKTGGLVEDGIFTMNKGEMAGTFDDGTSIVANNQQIISGIQQGVYSAVVSAMRQSGNGGVGDVYLDGRKVGQTTARYSHQENVRTGLVRATR